MPFKIRDRMTGLYSTGGSNPKWNAKGKTWKDIGPLRAHLTQLMHYYYFKGVPPVWDIVEFEMVEKATTQAWTYKPFKQAITKNKGMSPDTFREALEKALWAYFQKLDSRSPALYEFLGFDGEDCQVWDCTFPESERANVLFIRWFVKKQK